MGQKQKRLPIAAAMIARHEVAFFGMRTEDLNVGFGKARCLEPRGHGLGRLRRVSVNVRRIDFDELFVDLACELVGAVVAR